MNDLDTLHLRSHAEGVCRDWAAIGRLCNERFPTVLRTLYESEKADEIYEYSIDILCLMSLADAFGFEYVDFVRR